MTDNSPENDQPDTDITYGRPLTDDLVDLMKRYDQLDAADIDFSGLPTNAMEGFVVYKHSGEDDEWDEQTEREHLLYELLKAMGMYPQFEEHFNAGALWIHFTDWSNYYDLPLLESQGLLESTHELAPLQNNWRDKFRPTRYLLTEKAKWILQNRGQWVFEGKPDDES